MKRMRGNCHPGRWQSAPVKLLKVSSAERCRRHKVVFKIIEGKAAFSDNRRTAVLEFIGSRIVRLTEIVSGSLFDESKIRIKVDGAPVHSEIRVFTNSSEIFDSLKD